MIARLWFHPRVVCELSKELIDSSPANDAHEGVDVTPGLSAEVDMVGMLVHIERQDWRAPSQRVTMVGRPLIDELAVARRPRQQHPSRAATKRLAHGDEFGTPALIASKISAQNLLKNRPRPALFPKPLEEEFVKNHRVHCNELLPLEPVDEK